MGFEPIQACIRSQMQQVACFARCLCGRAALSKQAAATEAEYGRDFQPHHRPDLRPL